MTGMSARQFEKDVRRKVRKAFGKTVVATEQAFIEADGRRALRDVEYAHLQEVFPQAPHSHVHNLSMADRGCHRGDRTYHHRLDVGSGIWEPVTVTIPACWICPYCGADHDLTVKLCDCCGARRRREYVH